jgi:hypothetical protein
VPNAQAHIPVMPREAARRALSRRSRRWLRGASHAFAGRVQPRSMQMLQDVRDERPERSCRRTDPRDGVLRASRDVGGRRSSTSPAASDLCPARRPLSVRPQRPSSTAGAFPFLPFSEFPLPSRLHGCLPLRPGSAGGRLSLAHTAKPSCTLVWHDALNNYVSNFLCLA